MNKLIVIKNSNQVAIEYELENQHLKSTLNDVSKELDRMFAPRFQPSGLSYNPVGRLRKLNRQVIGELVKEEINDLKNHIHELTFKNHKLKKQLDRGYCTNDTKNKP